MTSQPSDQTLKAAVMAPEVPDVRRADMTEALPRVTSRALRANRVARTAIALVGLAPPVYLFIAIQYSALTYPFWDHTELLHWIAASYDGHLKWTSLWAPHNHSRPFFYRLVYLVNARVTGWDIRSEYIYMYLAIYGGFLVHTFGLWRITGRRLTTPFLASAALLSVVYFSPAGHNNHWWSMMLQLNLTNLFIVAAFWLLACRPSSPYAHVAAAASGWAATYTLTNGLVAMIALALVAHLTGSRIRVFGRRDVFWTTNLIVVAATYFPGLPPQPGGRPGPFDLARFTFIYLGAPVGDLIHYPFHGIFEVPAMTWLNGIIGFALAVLAVFVCLSARHRLRAGDPAAAILVGFTLFAFGSAVLTAWGRAKFDAFGVADANSSRYTVYSSFLVYGLIVFGAATVARPGWRLTGHARSRYTKRATFAAVCILVVAALGFSAVAYGRGVRVYRDAHHWNAELAQAYSLDSGARKLDRIIYPNPEVSEEIKSDLMRLHLGPYRFVRETAVEAAAVTGDSVYRGAVALKPGAPLSVRFRATDDGLDALGVTVVTWGQHSSGSLTWSLDRIAHQVSRHVTGGVLDLTNVNDWQTVRLPVGYVSSSRNSTFVLTVGASAPFSPSLGVPIYSESRGTPAASLTIAGRVYPRRALRVVAFYAHD